MRNRALTSVLLATLTAAAVAMTGVGCGSPQKNKIMADTPALPYQAPDADEIAGTDDEDEDEEAEEAAPTPVPASAQNPQK